MPAGSLSIQQYWQITKVLGGRSLIKQKGFFFTLLSVPLRKKLFGRRPRQLLITINARTYPFYVRDAADISVLYEVFVGQEYSIPLIEPKSIIDIGSHVGASVLFFATRYPLARIHAYEPDPDNFALLKKNVESLPHVECTQAAVGVNSATRTFYKNNDSSIRSSVFNRGGKQEVLEVSSVTLDDMLGGKEVDLVKFDVEGAELDLVANKQSLGYIKALVGELHHDLIAMTSQQFGSLFPGFVLNIRHAGKDHSIVFLHR